MNYQLEKEFKQKLKEDSEYLWKNQREIRQMLHPTLSDEYLPEDSKGLLSASRSSQSLLKTSESRKSIRQTPSM